MSGIRRTSSPDQEGGPPHRSGTQVSSEVFVEIVRLVIVAGSTAAGFQLGGGTAVDAEYPVLGAILGASVGYVLGGVVGRLLRQAMGTFEEEIQRAPAAQLAVGAIGAMLLGGLGALMGVAAVVLLPAYSGWPVFGLLVWVGVYAGFQAGARKGDELVGMLQRPAASEPAPLATATWDHGVLVDSSAAIDGRLLGVAEAGFLGQILLVPRFVLDELQGIADAQDPSRRRKGRRALDVLEALRHNPAVPFEVIDDDVPEVVEVDAKLVALARRLGAGLITVDTNLQRVAEIQGVRCLNMTRLAESVRPPLVPGEAVRLSIVREGREPGQGVGFLDDGTMVVVTGGAEYAGQDVDVVISSSVQTAQGRMFFASLAGR